MRALILAAGRGTRISRYLSGNPKCTVDIGGESLIEYTVKKLKEKGVQDIALALGYRHEVIFQILNNYNINFFYNPFFDVTNSIASAWFARDFLNCGDDVLIMNGDVFMEDALYDVILDSVKSPVLFADASRKEEADYKFKYEKGILQKYGKELQGDDITGEYIGAAKVSKGYLPTFIQTIEQMIDTQQHSVWWENVLYSRVPEMDIYVEESQGLFWAEVDYIEDYERILKFRGYKLDFEVNVHK